MKNPVNKNQVPVGIPFDFLKRMEKMLEDEYSAFLKTFYEEKNKSIRFNPKKYKIFKNIDYISSLFTSDFKRVSWDDLGYYYFGEQKDLTQHPYYHAGLYYLQEASAMAPVNFMPLSKGMKVLDLCSAPGGKTLQLSEFVGDEGLVVSNDISVSRQKATIRNIERFGLKNVIVSAENPEKISKFFEKYFDAILVDAPCSGEGIFTKDIKNALSWNSESPKNYSEIQKKLLNTVSGALKDGGFIMYSTCTFSEEENELVVRDFLNKNKDFELLPVKMSLNADTSGLLDGTVRLYPHRVEGLGHFFACLKKRGKDKFFVEEKISYVEAEFSNKLYLQPDLMGREKGIRILRSGLFLGEKTKHKFINSQAYAMSLDLNYNGNKLNLSIDEPDVHKYLKGETLIRKTPSGLTLIFVDSMPLGWASSDGVKLKNLYKKDWVV